jgi:hypothetical protein
MDSRLVKVYLFYDQSSEELIATNNFIHPHHDKPQISPLLHPIHKDDEPIIKPLLFTR